MSNWLQSPTLKQKLNDIREIGSSGAEVLFGADFT